MTCGVDFLTQYTDPQVITYRIENRTPTPPVARCKTPRLHPVRKYRYIKAKANYEGGELDCAVIIVTSLFGYR